MSTSSQPTRFVGRVALVVALAIMGDSLMYSLLPLEAANLGIPLALVGVLLSVNRIIRLLSNTWASLAFERLGPRLPFIFASLLSVVTTLVYGLGWGFVAFLLARGGWGLAWSVFRHGGYLAVWSAPENIKGRLMGILWGVVRLGSAVSVLVGGLIYDRFGYASTVFIITGLSALAIPVALQLRWPKHGAIGNAESGSTLAGWRVALQDRSRRWISTLGFVDTLFEGILVSTSSLFLASRLSADFSLLGIGTLAGALLATRFSANLLFAPLIGSISDRIGQALTLLILALVILLGMLGAVQLEGIGLLVSLAFVFIAGSGMFVTGSAAVSGLATSTERPNLFVGFYNTAVDAGAAIGPLLAYSLGDGLPGLEYLYVSVAGLLALVALRFWWVQRKKPALIQ
ncbi:MAG: MFS transporter [Chloroflexi bacterium]|nr:MAG: MFS transporter [Chloroflexota bacterium]MBL1193993.1 MFS transporter [Chloroflexota bacterium]NOH11287.1 MFS transporter [Chloroflexota bacterium]